MAEAAERDLYGYDVAVSFAGEDREFVADVVAQLKAEGIRVFYDNDYLPAMWGEDLVEYLDEIYRLKSRYVIIFVSQSYATRMWTRHESRSALARGLQQAEAYVLPVRLDDTAIDGLRPTVGYLDARLVGAAGVAQAIAAKLAGTAQKKARAFTRVPRTEDEQRQILAERPQGWEFLYYAARLLGERNSIEDKYRDYELGRAALTGEMVNGDNIGGYIDRSTADMQHLAAALESIQSLSIYERAFDTAEQSGETDWLTHLAVSWNGIYEGLIDWAAKFLGATTPYEFRQTLELRARYMDDVVREYRNFIETFVAKMDDLPAYVAAGGSQRLDGAVIAKQFEAASLRFRNEFGRVMKMLAHDDTIRWVEDVQFSTTRTRPGYDEEEVDEFIDEIRDTVAGMRNPPLTPADVKNKQFTTTRLKPGYAEEDVDAFLDEVERILALQE